MQYWSAMVPELSVSKFEKSKNFYTKTLGFSVIHERSNPSFAYLEYEKAQIMIEELKDDSWQTGKLEFPFGRGINFQIELTDISKIYENLKQTKYPLFKDLEENWYRVADVDSGQKEFLVQDPDGYLLRFCQYIGEREA